MGDGEERGGGRVLLQCAFWLIVENGDKKSIACEAFGCIYIIGLTQFASRSILLIRTCKEMVFHMNWSCRKLTVENASGHRRG